MNTAPSASRDFKHTGGGTPLPHNLKPKIQSNMNKPNTNSLRQQVKALPVGAYLEKVFSPSIDNTLRNYASSFKQEGRIYKVARKGETSVRITRIS